LRNLHPQCQKVSTTASLISMGPRPLPEAPFQWLGKNKSRRSSCCIGLRRYRHTYRPPCPSCGREQPRRRQHFGSQGSEYGFLARSLRGADLVCHTSYDRLHPMSHYVPAPPFPHHI